MSLNQFAIKHLTLSLEILLECGYAWGVFESCQPNSVLADLDGDGEKEILFASYDGCVHAFWLDKIEHGDWPFTVNQAFESILRFASEPLIADLDDDGRSEVLFTTWTQRGS